MRQAWNVIAVVTWLGSIMACGGGDDDTPAEEPDAAPAECAGACEVRGDDGACAPRPAGEVCRPAAGPCDVEETCDGEAAACPADELVPAEAEAICRVSAGACDIAETCDGEAAACPDDDLAPPATVCRPAEEGTCDAEETCTGEAVACPEDLPADAGASCGDYACPGDAFDCPTTCAADDDCANGTLCVEGACLDARWAFVSSGTTNGNIGGLAGADALCQGLADAAGLGGTYLAWLGDATGAPATRFTQTEIPWVMPRAGASALRLVDGWSDLTDASLDTVFNRSELGLVVASNIPYTNVTPTGLAGGVHCSNWTSASAGQSGNSGYSETTDGGWTVNGSTTCNVVHRLFCFEQ